MGKRKSKIIVTIFGFLAKFCFLFLGPLLIVWHEERNFDNKKKKKEEIRGIANFSSKLVSRK